MTGNNVLFISNVTNKLTNFVLPVIRVNQNLGNTIIVCSNQNKLEEKKIPGLSFQLLHQPITRFPISVGNLKSFLNLNRYIKINKIDVIHCNTPSGGLLGRALKLLNKDVTVIYTAHGFHFYPGQNRFFYFLYLFIEKILMSQSDVLIVINSDDFKAAQNHFKRDSLKILYQDGVGIELNQGVIDCDSEDNRSQSQKKITRIVCVGELNANKNHKVLIKSLTLLRDLEVEVLICGEGNEMEVLENLAHINGLSDKVKFMGYRNDIPNLLKQSDIFVLTSFREGLSRAIMEAMASGLPCICTNIRGNRDLIDHELGGYLFDPKNPEELARYIEILARNNDLRKKFSEYNLEKVKKYSVTQVSDFLTKLYREIR